MSPTVDEFLAPYPPQIRDLAGQARAFVVAAAPALAERVNPGWQTISYGTSEKMRDQVCYLAPTKAGVSLGFYRGTELPEPQGLLTGTGKLLRHVKLRRAADLDAPALRALLDAAAGNVAG